MRTLIVMEDAPYPPRRGSPLRNWQHVALFAKLGPTHVFSVGQSETDASMPIAASWHHVANGDFPQKRLKLVNRALRVLRPRQYPIDHEQATTKINDQLRQVIQATKPDLFVLANWHDALPDALLGVHPLILDAHNVESKLFSDLAERAGTRRSMKQRYRQWQFERKERSLLTAADKIWVTSEGRSRQAVRNVPFSVGLGLAECDRPQTLRNIARMEFFTRTAA